MTESIIYVSFFLFVHGLVDHVLYNLDSGKKKRPTSENIQKLGISFNNANQLNY